MGSGVAISSLWVPFREWGCLLSLYHNSLFLPSLLCNCVLVCGEKKQQQNVGLEEEEEEKVIGRLSFRFSH